MQFIRKTSDMTFWVKNVNSKTTIVMLHGIGSSSSFVSNIGSFKTNFNIIALDLPGSKNCPIEKDITIEKIADKVIHFIKHYVRSKKIVVLGHSMGGAITAHVVSNSPKIHEAVYVSPLTPYLANSSTYKFAEGFIHAEDTKMAQMKKSLIGNSLKIAAKTMGFKNLSTFTNEESSEYSLLKNNIYNNKYIKEVLLERYKSVKVTQTFIISEKDIVVNAEAVKEFAKDLNCELITVSGSDHNPFVASAEKLVEILNDKFPFEKRIVGRKIIQL